MDLTAVLSSIYEAGNLLNDVLFRIIAPTEEFTWNSGRLAFCIYSFSIKMIRMTRFGLYFQHFQPSVFHLTSSVDSKRLPNRHILRFGNR